MALAGLSGDEQRIIFSQLSRNVLDPHDAVAYGSASSELRVLTQAPRQQLRADYEAVAALGRKAYKPGRKKLCEAKRLEWHCSGLTAADLALLGKLGSVLPALHSLRASLSQEPAPTACSGWLRSWARARCRQ